MIRFQIGRLVSYQAVGGGVRLVKTVTGKLLEEVEDFIRPLVRNLVRIRTALDEDFPLLSHLFRVLLAHGAPQQVRRTETVTGQKVRRLLHLFLVDENAVGFLADVLHQRMEVLHFRLPFLTVDEVRDEVHGARAIEGEKRDDVLDSLHPEVPAEVGHASGFQLEHGGRRAPAQQFKGLFVIERDVLDFEIRCVPVDELHGIVDHGQRFQTEEVHFEHPQFRERAHGELSDGFAFVTAGERHVFRQVAGADDHTRRVNTGAAREAFQLHGGFVKLRHGPVGLDGGFHVRIFFLRVGQRDVELLRNHLRHAVYIAVTHPQHTAHIANH